MKNSRMENSRNTEEIIQIFVEDEKFSLNKNHLKKSSSFFNAMFSGRFAESNQNCIYLKGNLTQLKIIQLKIFIAEHITKEAFHIFVNYLSSGLLPPKIHASTIPELFIAAHYLDCHEFIAALYDKINDLVQKCASYRNGS